MQEKYGLYIHIPFCQNKCQYCDFVSYKDCLSYEKAYVDALILEMQSYPKTAIDTIYFGGGTPSLLRSDSICKLKEAIWDNFEVAASYEMTIEVNPKTVDLMKMLQYHDLGFNRISIGIQSFNDDELHKLGRIHSSADGISAVHMAAEASISNISIDLMYGFCPQSRESLRKTLDTAVRLPITHISCYGLKIEKNTPFGHLASQGSKIVLSDDICADMYEDISSYLKEHDFTRYEISNFCKINKESKHNLKYWRGAFYVGLGVAAHSYLLGKRRANTSNLEEYIKNPLMSFEETPLSFQDEKSEFIITALRLKDGFSLIEYQNRFGSDFRLDYEKPITKFSKLGFLSIENGHCFLTEKAFYVSNYILCEFVFEES